MNIFSAAVTVPRMVVSVCLLAAVCACATPPEMRATSNLGFAARATASPGFFYVGGNALIAFHLGGSHPIASIPQSNESDDIAIDRQNEVYVSSRSPYGQIAVYSPGLGQQLYVISTGPTLSMAFDESDRLYAAEGSGVYIYAAESTRIVRRIPKAGIANAIALDRNGDLFVARQGGHDVLVFPPNEKQPSRTITSGIAQPVQLLFTPAGNLYVANCPSCYAGKRPGAVTEYAPGASVPRRVLTLGVQQPVSMAYGNGGLLYVANQPSNPYTAGWVSIYNPTRPSPVRTITEGVSAPSSIAIAPNGNVYVANCHVCVGDGRPNDVTVYSPDGTHLIRKIVDSVTVGGILAIGGT